MATEEERWIAKLYRTRSSTSGTLLRCSGSLSKTTGPTVYFELRGSGTCELLSHWHRSSLVTVIDLSNPRLRRATDAEEVLPRPWLRSSS